MLKLKKDGKNLKLDVIKDHQSQLIVVDVSAVMRSNYVKLQPRYMLDGDTYYIVDDMTGQFITDAEGNRIPYVIPSNSKYLPRELSWNVDGRRFNTSAMYGLFKLFQTYGFNSHYVFCFDSVHNMRKDENEDYKKGRQKAEADYFDQLNAVRDILENVGYSCLSVPGFEGDDLVVETVNRNKDNYEHVIVISNDYDLSQVIDENVYFKHCLKKNDDITKENYTEKLKCPYNSILLYKALVGDSSDNIKGVKGFGPKSFYKFLESENIYNSMVNVRKHNLEKTFIMGSTTLSDDQKKEALKALWLVTPKVPTVYVEYVAKKSIRKDLLEMYFMKYGMKTLVKELQKYEDTDY